MPAASKAAIEKQPIKSAASDNGCCSEFADSKLYIICETCARPFQPRVRDVKRHLVYCCSRVCASRRAAKRGAARMHALYPQSGSANWNFKGWASKRPVVYTSRFKTENPEKLRCHWMVLNAIRSGKLVRPAACESCRKACRPDGHHRDYTKPLDVQWLCRRCHRKADLAVIASRKVS